MKTDIVSAVVRQPAACAMRASFADRLARTPQLLGLLALIFAAGCQTPPAVVASEQNPTKQDTTKPQEVITVREGDTLRISFPGTPTLDTTQQVRSDGRISLSIIGELKVVGLTPSELEAELVKQYAPQLLSKEVNVTVVSSTFDIYVTGAVMHPGKLTSNKPITAFQAIMESGGFDQTRANTCLLYTSPSPRD